MLRNGERIGPLRVERALGVGGMGEVYLALDERLERRVAVKLLPENRSLDPGARGRMLREARAASALHHPCIVTVHDVGEHDGRAYIVMEYVDGETFDALIARRGRLAPAEAIALFAQVGDAVAAAHAAGVLHRDLKPANLMLDAAGRVKVLDFGLSKRTEVAGAPSRPPTTSPPAVDPDAVTVAPASEEPDAGTAATETPRPTATTITGSEDPLTQHGARMGTPGWAPPELIDGRPADVRSDVFALGCVLYHLLTGRPPFRGTGWTALREQIDRGPPPPSELASDVPRRLDAIVLAALAADPARRPATARELVDRARGALVRRRGPVVAFAGAGVVALAIAGGVVLAGRGAGTPAVAAAPDAGPPPPPSPPYRMTKLGGCAYSPTFFDDHTIVFDLTKDGAVDLYKLDLDTGATVQLTNEPGWEWRSGPSDRPGEIAFIDQDDDGSALVALDLTTGARRPLFSGSGGYAFARGGYYYAPNRMNVLRVVRDGRDEIFLPLAAGDEIDTMTASRDGRRLAALINSDHVPLRLCVIELDHPSLDCLPPAVGVGRVAFSADGDAIYHDAEDGVARTTLADRATVVVMPDTDASGGVAVSPSGATIVFSDCKERTMLVDAVTGDAVVGDERVTDLATGRGGALAYVRLDRDGQSLMLRRAGDPVRQLVHRTHGRITDLAFSPDADRLVYAVGDPDDPGIYAIAVGDPQPNRLTENAGDQAPVFAEGVIAFVRTGADGPRLMTVHGDGTGETVAAQRPRLIVDADPDHHRVLVSDPSSEHMYWWDPRGGPETAGPRRASASHPMQLALSPDGRWLLTLTGNNGHDVIRQDLTRPGASEQVATLPDDRSANHGAIDEQGRALIAEDAWVGELWRANASPRAPW